MSATPVAVFDATPAGACGTICNLPAALTTDGTWAGLDCIDPAVAVNIDGVEVTACVGADFGAAVRLDPVVIRARAVADACGRPCRVGDGCDTGDSMSVFYGTTRGVYQWARDVALTQAFADYSVNLNVAARFVVVCRWTFGAHRDDVAVDSIRTGNACP